MPKEWAHLVGIVAGLLCGCGSWPPVVNSGYEVRRLNPSTQTVRARGLSYDELPSLELLTNLTTLDFGSGWKVREAKIDDAGLVRLASLDLPQLRMMTLGYCNSVSDQGLASLSGMNQLTQVSIMGCQGITDEGVAQLAKMKSLRWLDLRGCTGVTDAGIEALAAKTNWSAIMLAGCSNVTHEAVSKLQRALPSAEVTKDDWEWSFHR